MHLYQQIIFGEYRCCEKGLSFYILIYFCFPGVCRRQLCWCPSGHFTAVRHASQICQPTASWACYWCWGSTSQRLAPPCFGCWIQCCTCSSKYFWILRTGFHSTCQYKWQSVVPAGPITQRSTDATSILWLSLLHSSWHGCYKASGNKISILKWLKLKIARHKVERSQSMRRLIDIAVKVATKDNTKVMSVSPGGNWLRVW